MILRVQQTIQINKVPVCYNGKGEDSEGGVVHYFTSKMPGKETTFTVPSLSVPILSQVLDEAMNRYADVGKDGAKLDPSAPLLIKTTPNPGSRENHRQTDAREHLHALMVVKTDWCTD